MWTADTFLDVIEKGRVISRKDLRNIIIEIRESEYERGCEAMRQLYSDLSKKIKLNKKKKYEKEYNQITSELSDYAYKRRQETYYGEEGVDEFGKKKEDSSEPYKNGSSKRTRRIPK